MKITLLLFGTLGLLVAANFMELQSCPSKKSIANPTSTPPQKSVVNTVSKSNSEWKPAKFRELIMGSSNKKDALRVLGKPDSQDFPEGISEKDADPEWWMSYSSVIEMNHQGHLIVSLDKRKSIVLYVLFYPEDMKKSEIVDYFGKDFVITRYAPLICEGEESGLYESKDGNIKYHEYRSKGIAVLFDSSDEEKVVEVQYVSPDNTMEAKDSKCKSSANTKIVN